MSKMPAGVVVGGGLVGAASALGLAQQGYAVTLIEPSVPQITRGPMGVDIRNVALNPQSQTLLSQLEVWDPDIAVPYSAMRVWEESGTGVLDFRAQEMQCEALGWLVESSTLQQVLYQACEAALSVTQAQFTDIEVHAEGVTVATSAGPINADFVIAADGAQSSVRNKLNIGVKTRPVHQHALATVVQTSRHHDGVAHQRFLHTGPLALLPAESMIVNETERMDSLVSVVWSQPQELAEARREMPPQQFCDLLTHVSEGVLGEVLATEQRFCFPLTQQLADTFTYRQHVALVGDAARVVHPLAGLGVNLGFEDVVALLRVTAHGVGLQHVKELRTYARTRQARSAHMIRLLELLKDTYAEANPWLTWVRNLATRRLNNMHAVKQQIMREAMGLGPIARAG